MFLLCCMGYLQVLELIHSVQKHVENWEPLTVQKYVYV